MVRWIVELAPRVLRRFDERLVGVYHVSVVGMKMARELRKLVLG